MSGWTPRRDRPYRPRDRARGRVPAAGRHAQRLRHDLGRPRRRRRVCPVGTRLREPVVPASPALGPGPHPGRRGGARRAVRRPGARGRRRGERGVPREVRPVRGVHCRLRRLGRRSTFDPSARSSLDHCTGRGAALGSGPRPPSPPRAAAAAPNCAGPSPPASSAPPSTPTSPGRARSCGLRPEARASDPGRRRIDARRRVEFGSAGSRPLTRPPWRILLNKWSEWLDCTQSP
jgi:hypothetical protein